MTEPWSESDQLYMRAALLEAEKASASGEVPVGAVVVLAEEVVGHGHNRSIAAQDPSAHAEIVAMRDAGQRLQNYRLPGATLYVTLEPCAMCVGAMIQARITRLVFGSYDGKAGAAGSVIDLCSERALNHRFDVNGGLLQQECAASLRAFFQARR